LHWLKPIYKIELIMRWEGGVNVVEQIENEMNNMKDELCRVWIKNHNIKFILTSVKLFVIANLVCAMLIFVKIILFVLKKWNIVNVFPNIVKIHPN
jgi:hypothetical protein